MPRVVTRTGKFTPSPRNKDRAALNSRIKKSTFTHPGTVYERPVPAPVEEAEAPAEARGE